MISAMFYKECRAQAIPFAIAFAALMVIAIWQAHGQDALTLLVYFNAATILGAQAFGHEYHNSTITAALMQPMARSRIYLIKISALAVMLLLLAGAAAIAGRDWLGTIAIGRVALLGVPLLAALGTAPLMSMIGRGGIPGVFLTFGVNGAVMSIVVMIAALVITPGGLVRTDSTPVMVTTLTAVHAAMLVVSWRHFMGLEPREAHHELSGFSRFGTASAARHRGVWRALISKELHLQQVSFFMTAALMAIWIAVAVVISAVPAWSSFPIGAVALAYVNSFAAIVGITAITLEHRAGTRAMQLVQPVPVWQQWLVKVFIASLVAVVCGFILPVMLAAIVHTNLSAAMLARMVSLSFFLVVVGLYLASISAQTIVGLALAMPLALGIGRLLQFVADLERGFNATSPRDVLPGWALFFTVPPAVATLGAFMLWLAFVNYSSEEQNWPRSILQIVAIAAVASATMVFIV